MIKWGCYSAVEGHQKDSLNASVNLAQLGLCRKFPILILILSPLSKTGRNSA